MAPTNDRPSEQTALRHGLGITALAGLLELIVSTVDSSDGPSLDLVWLPASTIAWAALLPAGYFRRASSVFIYGLIAALIFVPRISAVLQERSRRGAAISVLEYDVARFLAGCLALATVCWWVARMRQATLDRTPLPEQAI